MIKRFIKEGKIKSCEVENNKVLTVINFNGLNTVNPSLDDFIKSGWEEYNPPPVEKYVPTLEEAVEQKIRERYTLNKELQIHRKRDSEPDEFKEYYDYVEQCIVAARNQQCRQE